MERFLALLAHNHNDKVGKDLWRLSREITEIVCPRINILCDQMPYPTPGLALIIHDLIYWEHA
jgi:hypothetical protein